MTQQSKQHPSTLTDADFIQAAKRLKCDVSAIRAVAEVESRGSGFIWVDDDKLPDKGEWRPKILLERHVMYRRYKKKHGYDDAINKVKYYPDVINTHSGGYIGGPNEHQRLAKARRIDKNIGLESASWGMFQIMGFHWHHLGYGSVVDFVLAMSVDEAAHLEAFVRFIEKNTNLVNAIRAHDWALFARTYNGKGYAKNRYDVKMRQAERRHRRNGANEPICRP